MHHFLCVDVMGPFFFVLSRVYDGGRGVNEKVMKNFNEFFD